MKNFMEKSVLDLSKLVIQVIIKIFQNLQVQCQEIETNTFHGNKN